MNIRQFLVEFWTSRVDIDGTSCQIDPAVEAVLSDAAMTRQAVTWAVGRIRTGSVGDAIKNRLTKTGRDVSKQETDTRGLVNDLIEHGLTLLDVRFGRLALGDYLPAHLRDYGETNVESGKTHILRGRFVIAVANACPNPDATVRSQLSLVEIEAIRDLIIARCPEPDEAERALAIA